MQFQGRKQSQTSSGTKIWEGIFPESGAAGVEFLGGEFFRGGAVGGEFPPPETGQKKILGGKCDIFLIFMFLFPFTCHCRAIELLNEPTGAYKTIIF